MQKQVREHLGNEQTDFKYGLLENRLILHRVANLPFRYFCQIVFFLTKPRGKKKLWPSGSSSRNVNQSLLKRGHFFAHPVFMLDTCPVPTKSFSQTNLKQSSNWDHFFMLSTSESLRRSPASIRNFQVLPGKSLNSIKLKPKAKSYAKKQVNVKVGITRPHFLGDEKFLSMNDHVLSQDPGFKKPTVLFDYFSMTTVHLQVKGRWPMHSRYNTLRKFVNVSLDYDIIGKS